MGNSDALGLLATDAAVAVGLVVNRSVALGSDAGADDFEDALDTAIDDPEVDSVVAVYIPPLNVSGEDVANVLAAVGEQSDKPLVSTFLAAQGIPAMLRVPDLAGHTAGRGSVPSYPAVESAVRALARVVDYSLWLRHPGDAVTEPPEGIDHAAAKRLVGEALIRYPEGRELEQDERERLLAAYGIRPWPRTRVSTQEEAIAAGERLGWDVVLKATHERLRNRPDLAHVWRNIDDAEEMSQAWTGLTSTIEDPDGAGFVVQASAPPGVPVSVASLEDPLFGPVVSFGIAGPLTDLLTDRSYRIPPLTSMDVSEMVREVRASPLLFGYRGAEIVDVAAVEELVLRVSHLQNDLPQVRMLDLGLVLVGAEGCAVLESAIRVEPMSDARSDWFARKLTRPAGDTMPD